MMKLEDLSNELLLCIWDPLLMTDVIYAFSNLNIRIHRMLLQYCGLYKELDLRYCSLSIFRYFSYEIVIRDEWRLNLSVLKLGNRYRCSQTNLLVDQVVKSFVKNYFARQGKQYDNSSNDIFRMIISFNKTFEPMFPQLHSLTIFQSVSMNEDCRDVLLYIIGGGSPMRTLIWRTCSYQTYHSKSFFNWLFQCSINLNKYILVNPVGEDSFELSYQHTLINDYRSHQSLLHLTINVLNLSTLYVIIHYLPKLKYLDIHISSIIELKNITDEHLPKCINYPKELHTLKFRCLNIRNKGCYEFEQLVLKFSESLKNFSVSMYHRCDDEPDLNYNGYYLEILCQKLINLQSLHFAIQLQLFDKPDINILTKFTRTFSTPFWLDGPFGCKRVCVDFHEIYGVIQMFSLPYICTDINLVRSIDLLNIQFNYDLEENKISKDLFNKLKSLWSGMNCLFLRFDQNQKLPLSFCQALQCSHSQGKTLILSKERGIMSDNVENHVQLTHFSILELNGSIDTNTTYNIERLLCWLKLLPNVDCLNIHLTEFQYWFTINENNSYLNSFLVRLQRLYVDCSSIINQEINEEIMNLFLSYVINKNRFPQLKCLRLMNCKNISSAWQNINQWIDFIRTHINEHQLTCLRFDFIEKNHEITEMYICDETLTILHPPCIINIHRFVHHNHIALWIERKYNCPL